MKFSSQTRAPASACLLDQDPLAVPQIRRQRRVQETRRSTRMRPLLRQPSSPGRAAGPPSVFRSLPMTQISLPGTHPLIRLPLEASSRVPRQHPRNPLQIQQILADQPLPRKRPLELHPALLQVLLQVLMASQRAARRLLRRVNPPVTPRVHRVLAKPPRQPKAARPMIPKTPPARRKRASGS